MKSYDSVPFYDVQIDGGFWQARQRVNREVTLPAVLRRFTDTGRFAALRCDWREGMPQKPHIFYDSDVAKWIIRQFRDAANPNKAQLIVNTQDQSLMSLDLLRRDQVWFTQKDMDTGASELYALSDFNGVRLDVDLQKSYSVNKYGARPFILNEDVMD